MLSRKLCLLRKCKYLPFWNCYAHSNMTQDHRAKLDQKHSGAIKQLLENNSVEEASNASLSIYDVYIQQGTG